MAPPNLLWLFASAIAVVLVNKWKFRRRSAGCPLPPGPAGWPIIGNLGQMPIGFTWLKYLEWGKELNSDIIYTKVFGSSFLIVNSFEKAVELLDKRSGIYSDRPASVLFDEIMGWGYMLSRLPYGDAWRERRRLFQQHLRPSKANMYQPKIIEHVRRSMIQFARRPDDSRNILRHTIGGFAMSLAYGITTHPYDDPHVRFAEEALRPLFVAGTPGVFLVNIFPPLRFLPAWFPGAKFKREAIKHQEAAAAFRERPFNDAISRIASSQASASFTSLALDHLFQTKLKDENESIQLVKDTAAIVFAAGADTTSSTIAFWIRSMLVYPDIQKRIQSEVDEVLQGRLPDFSDEVSLPWVKASVMETMRMFPTNPNALPHATTEDDIFEGYFIPRGTTIIPNTWAMLHDGTQYHDPMTYNPERFVKDGRINHEVLNPNKMAFGFGRRECPGSHIAEAVAFMVAGTILSIFDICKPLDEKGEPIEPNMGLQPGLVSHPEAFRCVFKVRNKTSQAILEDLESMYT